MNRCGNFSRASLISTKSNTAIALCVTALQPYHALTFCVKFGVTGPSCLGFWFKVDIEAIFLRRRGDWGRRPSAGRNIGRKTRSRSIVAAKVPGEAGLGT